jgi:hypothetical protein
MSLYAVSAAPGRGAEVGVLVLANLVATALRFVLYRGWVFAEPPQTPPAPSATQSMSRQSLGSVR